MNIHGLEINSRLKRSLSDMIDSGKLPHAIILEGGNSESRLGLARLLAAALVCTSQVNRPCKTCPACIKAFGEKPENKKLLNKKLKHPDISEVTKEPGKVQFGINPIRTIRNEAYIVPNEADVKVYILSDAHLMNIQAQNAFLKILEEPPSYVCFILECTSKNVLLPTVLSRSTCFNLGQLEQNDGISNKKQELARQTAAEIAGAITAPYEYDLLKKTAPFEKDKKLIGLCLPELELIVRDALIIKLGNAETCSCSPQSAAILARDLSKDKLIQLIDEIRLLYEATERSANNNLLMTRLCSNLKA